MEQKSNGTKIDRFYPSSKTCSSCFDVLPELPLSVCGWTCPRCGAKHDRDINAAVNILRVGASTLKGKDVRPVSVGCLCRSYNPILQSHDFSRGSMPSLTYLLALE
ncbi:MAG: transposase [Synergistaceae bacterium]|nr:transposase [Synergistaceae bacterium]